MFESVIGQIDTARANEVPKTRQYGSLTRSTRDWLASGPFVAQVAPYPVNNASATYSVQLSAARAVRLPIGRPALGWDDVANTGSVARQAYEQMQAPSAAALALSVNGGRCYMSMYGF